MEQRQALAAVSNSQRCPAAGHSGRLGKLGNGSGEFPRSPTTWQQVPIYGGAAVAAGG